MSQSNRTYLCQECQGHKPLSEMEWIDCNRMGVCRTCLDPHIRIGKNCRIGKGSVLGVDPLHITIEGQRHCRAVTDGLLKIGDNVDVGCNCVLNRGIDGDTIIHDNVFIGHLSSIGHDAEIGNNTVVSAHVCVLGRVKIGKWCYIGPQAVIRNRVTIGDYTVVGMGSVVTKDLPSSVIAHGVPCKVQRENTWRPGSKDAHPLRA